MRRHGRPPGHERLTAPQRRVTYVVFSIAWLSGVLWLVFHYFLQRRGEFALEPHPLEHWWLRLHGLCAFLLLTIGGMLWALHVRQGWRRPARRRSGVAIVLAFCTLAASGYLIYYADEGVARDAIVIAHWIVGLGLIVPILIHALPARPRAPAA